MKAQLTMENGKRWSSDKVLSHKYNPDLVVLTHARADKVSISNISFVSACMCITENNPKYNN